MNSVFSAFKSNKPSSSSSSTMTDGKPKITNKKMNGSNNIDASGSSSSYENLRHIREIGSSTKMNTFVDVNDDHLIGNNNKRSTVITVPSPITEIPMIGTDNYELNILAIDGIVGGSDTVDCSAEIKQHTIFNAKNSHLNQCVISTQQQQQQTISSASESNQCDSEQADGKSEKNEEKPPPEKSETKESCCGIGEKRNVLSDENAGASLVSSSCVASAPPLPPTNNGLHAPIILAANRGGGSESNLTSTASSTVTSNKTNRFQKRLSLSGFANNSLPSVHGRPTSAGAANGSGGNGAGGSGEVKKTRLSTHQRNLSLDFRLVHFYYLF